MNKTEALLHALSDGLTGYMTFESRCGMSQAYTEYLLYGPIVRIANHLDWRVESEWPHTKTNTAKVTRGDHQRIDFLFWHIKESDAGWVAIEVKCFGFVHLSFSPNRTKNTGSFLCLFPAREGWVSEA